jgi:glycosyltransferase involved in cell wall biosynthesis
VVVVEVVGVLDSPSPHDPAEVTGGPTRAMPGGILEVHGWVLFGGLPADRVEVYVGDQAPRPARRALPRPDLAPRLPASPGAVAAGFFAGVVVPRSAAEQVLDVRVRAFSELGDTWHSPTVRVPVTREPWYLDHPLTAGGRLRPARPRTDDDGRLRICVFTHSLHLAGGELYLDELLRRLMTTHHIDVTVVAPRGGPLAAGLADMGVEVHLTRPYEVRPDYYEGAVSELQALLNDIAPDVVLANTLGVFPAVDAALRQGREVVWAIHESFEIEDFIYLNWGSRGLQDDVGERMRAALAGAHTIFEAELTLDLYLRQIPELRGRHVHYGIDVGVIERYRQTHDRAVLRREAGIAGDETIVLSMGVFQERKAQLALVLAFATVAPKFPRARLVLVGEHPTEYAASVREAVQRFGVVDRVEIVPIQPDIYPWYTVADILVNASDVESLPRSILEAKAFGLPTLATDVFGLPEIISDGVNGWLCGAHSGNALVAGLYRALTTRPEVIEAMRENCLAEAPGFDGAGYAEAYYRLFTQLVQIQATRQLSGAPT